MCRMMACPPGSQQDLFLEVMLEMEKTNKHGFGIGWVENGEFHSRKTCLSLSETLKKRKDFFDGVFPNKSWLLGHCRFATRGEISARNSHPFASDKYLLVHNGTFKEAELVKFLLSRINKKLDYKSDTDSEVALKLLEMIGPKKFLKTTNAAGVYLALERSGRLWAIKSEYHDDLTLGKINKSKTFLASDLPWGSKYDHNEIDAGWHLFDTDGKLIAGKEKERKWQSVSIGGQRDYGSYVSDKSNNISHVGGGYLGTTREALNKELEEFKQNQERMFLGLDV